MVFEDIVDCIKEKLPLQKKRIEAFLREQDQAFFDDVEVFLSSYCLFLEKSGLDTSSVTDAYIRLCGSMQRAQMHYMRHGEYPVSSSSFARDTVYDERETMLPYMIGLALSQFLWPNHYSIYCFLKQAFFENRDTVRSYLEIGPGHGMFLEHALKTFSDLQYATAIDLSQTSLSLAQDFLHFIRPDNRVEFILGDITKTDTAKVYDFITMGEVLEHVEDPHSLLGSLRGRLSPQGRMFLSTCAHCPAIDHVYRFKSVAEIREMILGSGYAYVKELALPLGGMPVQQAEQENITINYCALLRLQ